MGMDRRRFTRRFLSRIAYAPCPLPEVPGQCWEWQGARCGPDGSYRQSWLDGRRQMAHRVAWKLLVGPLDDDDDLDHLCRNPPCVNPAHCEPVSHRENIQRGWDHKHTHREGHCAHGHPWTPENTHLNKRGGRTCRACRAAAARKHRAAHPDANRDACRRYQEKRQRERRAGRRDGEGG